MIRVTRSAVIDAPIERVWDVLRDFNSHTAWHPVVAESEIEGGEPSDQVGCVRRFTLRDGNRIREQLLALSDRDHSSTYCNLDVGGLQQVRPRHLHPAHREGLPCLHGMTLWNDSTPPCGP